MNDRYRAAVAAFDAQNAKDPTPIREGAADRPRQLVQAERLEAWVLRLAPEPSEALRLAARCQHLRRFEVPRSSFEDGLAGYHAWRRHLAIFHADEATKVLRDVGYDEATIAEVRRIVLKQDMRGSADVQTMEDALCLSFLEHELEEFATTQSQEKLLGILRKTWGKMSPRGRAAALELASHLPDATRTLVSEALDGAE